MKETNNFGWSKNSIADAIMYTIMGAPADQFDDIDEIFGEDIKTIEKFVKKNKITDRDQIECIFDEYSMNDLYSGLKGYMENLIDFGGLAMKVRVKDLDFMDGYPDGLSICGNTLNFVFQNQSGLDGKIAFID